MRASGGAITSPDSQTAPLPPAARAPTGLLSHKDPALSLGALGLIAQGPPHRARVEARIKGLRTGAAQLPQNEVLDQGPAVGRAEDLIDSGPELRVLHALPSLRAAGPGSAHRSCPTRPHPAHRGNNPGTSWTAGEAEEPSGAVGPAGLIAGRCPADG